MTAPDTPAPAGLKAAIYCRISQDLTGEGRGVTRQLEDCTALATTLGWPVVEVYTDNDVSASTKRTRPAYRRLLTDIENGLIDAIVVWQPDRLYRKLADLEHLIPIIEERGVLVRTVKAGDLDLSSAYGRMIARVLGAIMTGEGEVKAERWKRSWRQGREAGTPARTGSRLFGYTRDGQLLDAAHVRKHGGIDEATIARGIAADVIAGVPINTIARRLDADGITTTRGGVWRAGTIRQYLANPRIAGYSTLGGEIVAEGTWEPLLDRDTWETIRALLTSRARAYVPRVSLLNGMIFCGGTHPNGDPCGHRMITSSQRGKRTYRCPDRPGMPGCGRVSGNAEPIEELVELYAQERLNDPKVRRALQQVSTVGAPKVLTEIAALEARITELEDQLAEPGQPVARLTRAIDRATDKLADLQRQLSAATPVAPPATAGEWPEDLERRRRLVELVVEKVRLEPSTRWVRPFDFERVQIKRRDF